MRICEIYKSLQGEGSLTGTESVFLRTTGCNLRCGFCDTPYTSWEPEGQAIAIDELVAECLEFDCRHLVLTGGEPMLPADSVTLTDRLSAAGLHITIETAGTIDRPVACDLMSISPKLANSLPSAERGGFWRQRHERLRHQPAVIQRLTTEYDCQIKFVVDHPDDFPEIERWLDEFPHVSPDHVWLMPQGVDPGELADREQWLRPWCERRGFHFCPRMHIEWFGNRRGT